MPDVKKLGKVSATEKNPSTIDDFYFWTKAGVVLNPFDIVKVSHINGSTTYGAIESISHVTTPQVTCPALSPLILAR